MKYLKSNSFFHEFSGLSVWLEPDLGEVSDLVGEMAALAEECGGKESGMHPFNPHCTLLYNTHVPGSVGLDVADDLEVNGKKLLQKCLDQIKACVDSDIELIPTEHFYFHYPKSADGGRGFGCVISLLKYELTPELQKIHDVVAEVFPPDERHGGGDGDAATKGGDFIPHLSLIYAPESMDERLKERTLEMEAEKRHTGRSYRAKYLSLVSTRGTIGDWYEIAKVKL